MSNLQVEARALGDPTRHEIFRYLVDAGGPIDVAELTEHFGFNHNAIRQHLAKLMDAGLVSEAVGAPTGRGRPRLQYTIDPSAEGRWGMSGPYERLAVLLTEIVRSGDSPVEVGRRAGLRQRLGDSDGDSVKEFVSFMARQGFEPTVRRRGDVVDVTLQVCPFATAVLADPDTICALHLGLARGVAQSLGGITVEALTPKDPRRAHCRLRCRTVSEVS